MPRSTRHIAGLFWALALGAACLGEPAHAGTPISLYRSFAGNLNYVATGGSLRTQPNTGNACAVTNSNTQTAETRLARRGANRRLTSALRRSSARRPRNRETLERQARLGPADVIAINSPWLNC